MTWNLRATFFEEDSECLLHRVNFLSTPIFRPPFDDSKNPVDLSIRVDPTWAHIASFPYRTGRSTHAQNISPSVPEEKKCRKGDSLHRMLSNVAHVQFQAWILSSLIGYTNLILQIIVTGCDILIPLLNRMSWLYRLLSSSMRKRLVKLAIFILIFLCFCTIVILLFTVAKVTAAGTCC